MRDPALPLQLGVLLSFALLAGIRLSAAGEQDAPGMLTITGQVVTVTARGWPTPLSTTPGRVALLDRATLERLSPLGLDDVLHVVPGVDPASDGAWGTEVTIRGFSRNSVVMLIDGCRVNTATDLSARFGLINPMSIERVEILKGPVSALYGSGSLGGVVNILTRQGSFSKDPVKDLGISARYVDNPDGIVGYAFSETSSADSYLFASQSYRDFDEYEDGDGQTVHNSQFSDMETRVGFGKRIGERQTLKSTLNFVEGREIGLPGTGVAPLPAQADVTYPKTRRILWNTVYIIEPGYPWLRESRAQFYYQRIERRTRIDAFPATSPLDAVRPEADHDTYGCKWMNRIVTGNHDISAGLDVWQRRLSSERTRLLKSGVLQSDTPLPRSRYTSAGVFIEDDAALSDALTLNIGGRLDGILVNNDTTETWEAREEETASWNAHVGASWAMGAGFISKGVLASGYRAASLEERYQFLQLGGGAVKLGDPDLDSERSRFAEVGLDWQGRIADASVSVFVNELEDLIGEEQVDESTVVNANVDEARIQGAEATAGLSPMPGLRFHAVLSYVEGKDTQNDSDLPGIPPLNASVGILVGSKPGWRGGAEAIFADNQGNVPEGMSPTPGWATVGLSLGHAGHWRGIKHACAIKIANLLDKSYRQHLSTYRNLDTLERGRSISVSLSLLF